MRKSFVQHRGGRIYSSGKLLLGRRCIAYVCQLRATGRSLQLEELWVLPTLIKLVLLERILSQADALLHSPSTPEASDPALLTRRIKSLREIGFADWPSVMEPMVAFDTILQQDPAQAYPRMDFDSRELYRKRVAAIAKHSECSEIQVAQAALALAAEAYQQQLADARIHMRHSHIGYYLIDRGFDRLRAKIGYRHRLSTGCV